MSSIIRSRGKRKLEAARVLSDFPGVVGVFWAQRHRGGAWREERCLSVHVHTKRPRGEIPRDQLLPERASGYPVDVFEVGDVSVHARSLDHTDRAHPDASCSSAGSSVTLVTYREGEGAYALLSGHGVLPIEGGCFLPAPGPTPRHVFVSDESSVFDGLLINGVVSSSADYALACFPDLSADEAWTRHCLAGRCPVRFRSSVPAFGEVLRHYSVIRRDYRRARFKGVSLTPVKFRCGGVGDLWYDDLLSVETDQPEPFSTKGDSGSLAVDDIGRAVGTVVGGNGSTSYILRTTSIATRLWDSFGWFFRS